MNDWRQIEGRNPILEAIRIPQRVKRIYLSQAVRKDARIEEIFQLARKQRIEVLKIGPKKLQQRSKTKIHQGIIALADYPPIQTLSQLIEIGFKTDGGPFFVALSGADYEQNLGAIIRSAEAAGVNGLIIPQSVDPYTPVVSRASMGAIEHLPIIQTNLFSAFKLLSQNAIKLVAASEKASQTLWQTDLSGPICLVIGAEHQGFSQTLAKRIDQSIRIPLKGQIKSLNMSVAAGITIFEVLRRRLM